MRKQVLGLCLGVVAACGLTSAAAAAEIKKPGNYPAKPVEMIVSYAAGGGLDTTIRVIAKYAEPVLGQRIVVSNKTGGGNIQGNVEAMRARPDGYVLGTWGNGLATDELILKGIPYKHDDVQVVCMIGNDPNVITVGKKFAETHKIKTLQDLLDYAKANPGKVTFGAGGNWTPHDFLRIQMEEKTGVKFNRMPFAGGAPALQATAAGNCDMVVPVLPELLAMIDSGLIVPLAVAYKERVSQLPNVPTTAEAGYPGMEMGVWRVLSVPKSTPKPVVAYLESVFEQTLKNPEFIEAARKIGINPAYMNSADVTKFVNKEYDYYANKTKEWGIRVQ